MKLALLPCLTMAIVLITLSVIIYKMTSDKFNAEKSKYVKNI